LTWRNWMGRELMDREKFERLVVQAIENLPDELHERLENIDVTVEERPTRAQMTNSGLSRDDTLLGLYEGVPLTWRGAHYGMVVPDKITIFQKPIESRCRNNAQVVAEVRSVVLHEIAHHFGISDERLAELLGDED